MVNFVVWQDFGLEFFCQGQTSKAKAKATKFGLNAHHWYFREITTSVR